MAAVRNVDQCMRVYDAVARLGPCLVSDLARALGMQERHVESVLPGLESAGLLLAENDYGWLEAYGVAYWARE